MKNKIKIVLSENARLTELVVIIVSKYIKTPTYKEPKFCKEESKRRDINT